MANVSIWLNRLLKAIKRAAQAARKGGDSHYKIVNDLSAQGSKSVLPDSDALQTGSVKPLPPAMPEAAMFCGRRLAPCHPNAAARQSSAAGYAAVTQHRHRRGIRADAKYITIGAGENAEDDVANNHRHRIANPRPGTFFVILRRNWSTAITNNTRQKK